MTNHTPVGDINSAFLLLLTSWANPQNLRYACKKKLQINPLSDQDRISPYNINTIIKQMSDENKEKYQVGNY